MKHEPAKFFVAWTLQAVWVWVTLLPVLIVNSMPAPAALRPWDAVGACVCTFGYGMLLVVQGTHGSRTVPPTGARAPPLHSSAGVTYSNTCTCGLATHCALLLAQPSHAPPPPQTLCWTIHAAAMGL